MLTASHRHGAARLLVTILIFIALYACAALPGAAQEPTPTPTPTTTPTTTPSPTPTPAPSVQPEPAPAAQATPAAETVSASAPEPLFREYKGVALGMKADDVRAKLGRPKEQDKSQDIFVFSDTERARVYYDGEGKATAVIVTYIGKSAPAPAPKEVIGTDIEPGEGGALYRMVTYPSAGYWVAYSRTAGDEPLTTITMQKAAGAKP